MQVSGQEAFMIKTPRESPVEYGIIWFQADVSQDIALAQKALAGVKDHAGLILGRRGFGYRVPSEQMAAAKTAQGIDPTPQYTIQGLPPEMQSEDVLELMKAIDWPAEVLADSRRVVKGGAVWKVKSDHAPKALAMQFNYGEQKCRLHIRQLGVQQHTERPKQAPAANTYPAPRNWAEATAPRVLRKQQADTEDKVAHTPRVTEAPTVDASMADADSKKRKVAFASPPPMNQLQDQVAALSDRMTRSDKILEQLLLGCAKSQQGKWICG